MFKTLFSDINLSMRPNLFLVARLLLPVIFNGDRKKRKPKLF
jgi:hypothetical protein